MTEPSDQAKLRKPSEQQEVAADIVLAIPSYNNEKTIEHVVRAAQACLERYYGAQKGTILHCDGGSKDGTPDRVRELGLPEGALLQLPYPVYSVHRLSSSYEGIPGKVNAIQAIFTHARKLGAKACAVVDGSLSSVTPEWVRSLVSPVFESGFDFVSPYYLRHKYDGAITSGIVYPLMRALYGRRVRHPIGGDFAFSTAMIDHVLEKDAWDSEGRRSGVDIWLTTQAVCSGFRLCQAFLGPRVHTPDQQGPDLSDTLAQVLGAVYTEMERFPSAWQRPRASEAVPTFGFLPPGDGEPAAVNVSPMLQSFRVGHDTLQEIWGRVLSPATMLGLKRLSRNGEKEFRFPDELWARIVYDFSLSHRLRIMAREHLLRAVTPLYLGWLASLVLETQDGTTAQVERRIEKLCLVYEAQKPYLISRWRWPDHFNP